MSLGLLGSRVIMMRIIARSKEGGREEISRSRIRKEPLVIFSISRTSAAILSVRRP